MGNSNLERALADWDGKATAPMLAAYDSHSGDPGFAKSLVEFLRTPDLQVSSSWLIKHHLEAGAKLGKRLESKIFQLLGELQRWDARLHILQIFPHMTFDRKHEPQIEAFIRNSIADKKPFVRAWGFNAFDLLAQCFEEYRAECDELLEQASQTETASVKARIRNIRKGR